MPDQSTPLPPGKKRCNTCGDVKKTTEFSPNYNAPGCVAARCKACTLARQRELRTLTVPARKPYNTPNPWRLNGAIAYIGLTDERGVIIAEALVDACDLERALNYGRWNLCASLRRGRRFTYATCALRRANPHYTKPNQRQHLHRLVLDAPPGRALVVDHLNGDGLDCRRANLRLVTTSENATNLHTHRRIADLEAEFARLTDALARALTPE